MKDFIVTDALELAKVNYTEYSKYVAQGRSYPSIYDGAKSSYKRAIYGMFMNRTSKIVKVAELAAHALPYHPHPTSVAGVIIQLGDGGNKLKLMDTQGNWGNSARHIEPSAERYIGGRLSNLAEHLLCDSIEYCKFIPGEIDRDEPLALPALIPLCFINGNSGIPSGLPTLNIPTIDIMGMIDYYLDILAHKDVNYRPKKYPKPNLEINVLSSVEDWNAVLETGRGSIRTAPIMSIDGNVITITGLPKTKTVEHVRKAVEKELLLDKIDLRDETADTVRIVIEKVPHKQCDMKELFKRLYAKLQSSETYNMAFFDEEKIYVPCGFHKVVRTNLQYVMDTQRNRLEKELEQLKIRLRVLEIIEDMKRQNSLKSLFDLDSKAALRYICTTYTCSQDIATKVLQKPLSYLTKEHGKELVDLRADIAANEEAQRDIYEFMSRKYRALKRVLAPVLKGKFAPTTFIDK